MCTFPYLPCFRLNELQSNRQRLADSEADKQRLMRDGEELITKMQWLQKINVQVRRAPFQQTSDRGHNVGFLGFFGRFLLTEFWV